MNRTKLPALPDAPSCWDDVSPPMRVLSLALLDLGECAAMGRVARELLNAGAIAAHTSDMPLSDFLTLAVTAYQTQRAADEQRKEADRGFQA